MCSELSTAGMFRVFLIFSLFCYCHGNLEGPFLFFGPHSLQKYRRPALQSLDQDDLMRIYGEQTAIVVFNNQDSVPLSSGIFPRLRKMLEGQTTLVLPQDFLDVHPDYISNETQVSLHCHWVIMLYICILFCMYLIIFVYYSCYIIIYLNYFNKY